MGASESLLPVSTMLAPRIPGCTPQACWLSPQGAWGGFGSIRFQVLRQEPVRVHSSLGGKMLQPESPQRCTAGTDDLFSHQKGVCLQCRGKYRLRRQHRYEIMKESDVSGAPRLIHALYRVDKSLLWSPPSSKGDPTDYPIFCLYHAVLGTSNSIWEPKV